VSIAPITHRQLEEPVSLPVQVSLAAFSGSGDQIDALRSLKNIGVPSAPRGLEEAIFARLHKKLESRLNRLRRIDNRQRIGIVSK